MNKTGITVSIFCYNSENRITETLQHLSRQKFSTSVDWEILLIDNNSKDQTIKVAEQVWHSCNCAVPFRIVREEQQGLSYSKMRAINEANYDIVVFVDDDNWLFDNYVETAFTFMIQHPEVGLCGGQSIAKYEEMPAEWFDEFKNIIAIGKQGSKTEDVTSDRQFVWGAGSVIRKSAIVKAINYGFKIITTGRKGGKLLAGDDLELSNAIRASNYKIYYNESLILYHYIPGFRVQWPYIKKIYKGFGASSIWLDIYDWEFKKKYTSLPVFILWCRHFLAFVKPLIKFNFLLLFPRFFPMGSKLATQIEYSLGRLRELFSTPYGEYKEKATIVRCFFDSLRTIK